MADSPRYGRALAIFAVLGVFFALEIGALLHAGCFAHDGPILPALLFLVPLATSVAGLTLAWSAARGTGKAIAAAVIVLLVLATATGATVGVIWWPPQGVIEGAGDGLAIGMGALVVLLPFLGALSTRVRRGSLLDVGDGWMGWAFSGTAVAVSALATLPRWNRYPTCDVDSTASVVLGAIGACGAAVACALLFMHRRRVTRLLDDPNGRFDLGIGNVRVEIWNGGPTAYRDVLVNAAVVIGDPDAARRSLTRSTHLAFACAAFALAAAGLVATLR